MLDIRQRRAEHLAGLRHLYPIPGPIPDQVAETEYQTPVRDGSTITVKIYIPTDSTSKATDRPLIVMFHEGGWCMGDLSDEDLNCRMFARDLHAVCVNVEYRLAPEHPFPVGVDDAWNAVQWAAANASPDSRILPANPRRGFIVGGASAGGNFAAVMGQRARDEGLSPPLTGQYLCVPALLSYTVPEKWKADYRSRTESKLDPVLKIDPSKPSPTSKALKPDRTSLKYNPLLHEDFSGLPPVFLQLGGLDPLRDDGLLYESALREAGTPTRMQVYDGFGHMFWTNWPELEQSRRFVQDTLDGFRWLLEQAES